jgi:hypothetical protein
MSFRCIRGRVALVQRHGRGWRSQPEVKLDIIFDRMLAFSDGIAPHDDIRAGVLKVLP